MCRSCWFLKFIFTVSFICILPLSLLFKFCFEVYFKFQIEVCNKFIVSSPKKNPLHIHPMLFVSGSMRYPPKDSDSETGGSTVVTPPHSSNVMNWPKLWAMVPTTSLQMTLGSHVEGAHTCCKQLRRQFNLVTPNYYCFVPYKVFTGWLLPDFAGAQYLNWRAGVLTH